MTLVPTPKISYKNLGGVKAYLARYPEIEDFLEAAWPNWLTGYNQWMTLK